MAEGFLHLFFEFLMMEDRLVNASQMIFRIPSDENSLGGLSGMLSGATLQTNSTLPDLAVTHQLLSMSCSFLSRTLDTATGIHL